MITTFRACLRHLRGLGIIGVVAGFGLAAAACGSHSAGATGTASNPGTTVSSAAASGEQAAAQAIASAQANPAYTKVVTTVTPCFGGNNPNTQAGQVSLLLLVFHQRHAIEAHKPGTVVSCAETKLQMTPAQKTAFESAIAPMVVADLKLPDHRIQTFVYVSLPQAYLKATGGATPSAASSVSPSPSASS